MVFLLLKTSVTPNMVTFFYVTLNIITGVLFAIPSKVTVCVAVLLAFIKPALDWGDGSLARLKNTCSVTGDVLDNFAGHVSWVFFWAGIGVYLGNYTNYLFYILAPAIPAIYACDIYASARERFVYYYFNKKDLREASGDGSKDTGYEVLKKSRFAVIKSLVDRVFEHNTLTVDLICIFILIEVFTGMRILWAYYSAFLAWQALSFFIRLYMVSFKMAAESDLKKLRKILYE